MKNRVKGLLALCLAMCMVLAMTTVAFGAEPYHYIEIPDGSTSEDGLILQAGAQITTVKGNYSGRSFFVVDGSGNYSTTMNTEANGAHGDAYASISSTEKMKYFDKNESDTFTLPTMAGYEYNVQRMDVDEANWLYVTQNDTEANVMVANALKVTPMVKGGYTVKYDLDGGKIGDKTLIDDKTNVKWTDKVLDGVTNPTKDGFTFDGWWYNEFPNVQINAATAYSDLAGSDAVMSIELKALWKDSSAVSPNPTPNPSTPDKMPNAPSGGDTIHRQNVTADAKADTTKTDTIASPKTFDAGVAVYAGLSLLSAAGTAIVIGRKKEF